MSNYYRLDENKNAIPCSIDEFLEQYREMTEKGTKHVAKETINGKWISTVFLGIYCGSMAYSKIKIFETMIYDEDRNTWLDYCDGYSTWKEAEEGHERAIQWVKNECKKDDAINDDIVL